MFGETQLTGTGAGANEGPPARRAYDRHTVHADIEILTPVEAKGVVLNVSAGGLRAALDTPIDVGQLIVARITTGDGETMERARAVWQRQLPDGCVIGFERV